VQAVVVASGEAMFTMTAGDGGLDGYTHTFAVRRDAGSHGRDNANGFMPKHHRIRGAVVSYAAVQIPMKIASTNAYLLQPDKYFARTGIGWRWSVTQLKPPRRDKLNAEHFQSPQYIVWVAERQCRAEHTCGAGRPLSACPASLKATGFQLNFGGTR
jgi:hypothetical protein